MKAKMIVLFAHWCPKCNMMMPVVDEIERNYSERLEIVRIDVDKCSDAMEEYGAEIVPTFVLIKDEYEIGRMTGMIGEKVFYERIDRMLQEEGENSE